MDFDLTDEQQLLKESVERLLKDAYAFEQRAALRALPGGYSREMWRQFADLGLLALPFAESDGGLGGGAVDVMLLMEAFGRALVLEPYLATIVLSGGCLRHAANAMQRADWLPDILSGETTYAFAHVERAARFDLAHVDTTAKRSGDGWIIDGAKSFVTHGDSADRLVVSARFDDATATGSGIGLFVVDSAAPGLTRRAYPTQDGLRAADVRLSGVTVSEDRRLAESDGLATILRVTDEGIAAVCAEATGVMDRAHEITVEYLKQRRQFGVPIGSFQALQHRAVDMLVMVEQARSMTYYATMMVAGDDSEVRGAAISAAKVQVGRSARYVGEQAVQLHGGIGVTEECSVGHYYRRLTLLEILFGDSDYHLARVARAGGVEGAAESA